MKEMKADIDHKYGSIEKIVEAFEQHISSMETKLKENVKEEEEGTKKVSKEESKASFQMLEEEFKKKTVLLDETQQTHNNLEQYTGKNRVRLFGVKEAEDEMSTPERLAIDIFKEKLRVEIEIANRDGKFRPEGKHAERRRERS